MSLTHAINNETGRFRLAACLDLIVPSLPLTLICSVKQFFSVYQFAFKGKTVHSPLFERSSLSALHPSVDGVIWVGFYVPIHLVSKDSIYLLRAILVV